MAQARVGDPLVCAGPRGSFIIPDAFDWQLMIGDETALPAIGRRLEALPQGHKMHVIALVQDASEEQAFDSRADLQVSWIHRKASGDHGLQDAVRAFSPPPGEGYVWGAGEAAKCAPFINT